MDKKASQFRSFIEVSRQLANTTDKQLMNSMNEIFQLFLNHNQSQKFRESLLKLLFN